MNLPIENQRIKEIIDKTGYNPATFADNININRATISTILNGRVNRNGEKYFPTPSSDVIQKILKTYNNINPSWLISGTLPMYNDEKTKLVPTPAPDLFAQNSIISANNTVKTEYAKENGVKEAEKELKNPFDQEIMLPKITAKKIDKIIIFYNDNTFKSFLPEQ
jgi:DNA-binding XRE family transcriptional regulator